MIGRLSSYLSCLVLMSCASTKNEHKSSDNSTAPIKPIILEGTYQGKNLYVQNPYFEGGFCMTEVMVNKLVILDSSQLQVSAIEIKLDSLFSETGDTVVIEISHRANCYPKVLNTGN